MINRYARCCLSYDTTMTINLQFYVLVNKCDVFFFGLLYSVSITTKCPEANDAVCSCTGSKKTCICEEIPSENCTDGEPYSAAVCDANSCKSVTGKQVLPSQQASVF